MDKILKFIADKTQGECFTSFKYHYGNVASLAIKYEDRVSNYIHFGYFVTDPIFRYPVEARILYKVKSLVLVTSHSFLCLISSDVLAAQAVVACWGEK